MPVLQVETPASIDEAAIRAEPVAETPLARPGLWALGVCAFITVVLAARIADFGIWDPWELSSADAARRMAAGEPTPAGTTFGAFLVSLGFRLFGVHEWAGRAPIVLAGVIAVFCAYLIGSRFSSARSGLYAALISGTSPLFILNARTMLGAAADFALQSALALAVFSALLPAAAVSGDGVTAEPESATLGRQRLAWLGLALVMVVLTVSTRGALLSALPPLAAGVVVGWLERPAARSGRLALAVLSAVLLALLLLVSRDVARDSADFSVWLGGKPESLNPQTFDTVLEQVFHAFAPWSALLPVAIGFLWLAGTGSEAPAELDRGGAERALRYTCLAWAAFGYGAQTLFESRYGREVTFLPVVSLALLVALFLREVERRGESLWAAGLAALFATGLIVRDYALYPQGPLQGLPIAGTIDMPKVFQPIGAFSALFGAFALFSLLGLCTDADAKSVDLRTPYRFLRAQWRRGWPFKLWLIAIGLALLGLCVFAILAYAIPARLHMPTLALKWVRRLLYLPLLLALTLAAVQLLFAGAARLGRARFVPLLLVGAASGVYTAQGFLPGFSEHFSPREVYASYNALAKPGEPLGEYRVGGRAAAYYAKGEVVELSGVGAVVDHLSKPGQRWAAFPSDDLAEVDRSYRSRTHRHLLVTDARSARVLLVATQAIPGRSDDNPLRNSVLSAAPAQIQHPVSVGFDDRIELLGYDLALPHDSYVGAGESFTLTWYFRVLKRVPGGYRLFVHIDGQGQRIHGDHDPVDGKYPVQLWAEGDVIVDAQKIDVPASYRSGDYTILMGFYSGDTRLPIKQGPNEGENRARIGVLRIQ